MVWIDSQLSDDPNNGKLWFQRALLLYEHGDWAECLANLNTAQRLGPVEMPILWWRGQALDAAGETENAKAAYDSFLKIQPTHWGALASRARVQLKLSAQKEALDDYRAALANNPNAEADLVQEVADALNAAGLTDEAITVLTAALARIGPIPSLQTKLLGIETADSRYDSALSRIAAFQAAAPRPEPWMVKYAAILAEADRPDESRAAWKALIAHLDMLPPAEKKSHAMTLIQEQARSAVTAIDAHRKRPVSFRQSK